MSIFNLSIPLWQLAAYSPALAFESSMLVTVSSYFLFFLFLAGLVDGLYAGRQSISSRCQFLYQNIHIWNKQNKAFTYQDVKPECYLSGCLF